MGVNDFKSQTQTLDPNSGLTGTSANVYYTDHVTGKEWEVGVIASKGGATDCNTATSNGIVENMFENIPNSVVPGLIVSGPTSAGKIDGTANGGCKYAVTFTHNPGKLHNIRLETHIPSPAAVGELEGTQYTKTTVGLTFDAFHVTADG